MYYVTCSLIYFTAGGLAKQPCKRLLTGMAFNGIKLAANNKTTAFNV